MPVNTALSPSFEPGQGFYGGRRFLKASGIALTKGQLLSVNAATTPDSLIVAPTTAVRPFYYCLETAAIGTTTVSVTQTGVVQLRADGAIEPGRIVMRSGTTAGEVVTYDSVDPETVVGTYIGKPGQSAGDQTAAADGDWIQVRLGVA